MFYSKERRERSVKFKKWNIGKPAEQDVALLRSAGYPYLLSTVLAARGIATAEAAAESLELEREPEMVISAESKALRFFSKEELENIEIVVTHSDIVEDWFINR